MPASSSDAPVNSLSHWATKRTELVNDHAAQTHLYGVLPTFRRPRHLAETLARVSRQERTIDHLVIVDNSPGPQSRAVVEGFARDGGRIEYLPAPENLGFAGGVALGMEAVLPDADDDDWIVVFDDDDPLPWDSVFGDLEVFGARMVSVDARTAAVGLVGARFDWRRGGLTRVPDDELKGAVPVDFIGGNHFPLYRVGALRDVGTFSRDIFFGLSEIEHGLRLRKAGYSIYADGDAWRRRREEAGRLGIDIHPSLRFPQLNWRRYYSLRNVIFILRSHGKLGTAARVTLVKGIGKPLVNLLLDPRAGWRHLALNVRAIRDGWTGRMGRTLEPDGGPRPRNVSR